MDPWSNCQTDVNLTGAIENTNFLAFEDNFKPTVRHTLPDSEQYLAVLEEKLNKLKSDPNVLRQLAEKREACMRELLNGSIDSNAEEERQLEFEAPIANPSVILRTVLPQKQALTQGEIVELVRYDQLMDESETSN